MPNFGKEGACGDFNDFSNSTLHPDYSEIPFSSSNSDYNLLFWQLVNKKIDNLNENSPSLFMDAKRKALFDYDDKIGNFDNLYYPLMVMWYFIGATMTMLILAGILILERPKIGSKKNQENDEIIESDTSSTTYETGESNPSQEDDAVPDKTEIDQSQVDIKPAAAASTKNEETMSKIQARQRVSSRISQRIAESLQISMPAGYLPNPANKNLDITGASEVEGGKTVVKEDGSVVQEKVGLFSMKLATQPSFICHSVAQLLLVWGGAVFSNFFGKFCMQR